MPLFRSSPSGQLVDSGEFIPAGSSNRQIPAWVEQNTNWQPTALTAILPGAPLYDVLNFGAVGDGIADDTAALNAAIAAANAVPGAIYLASRHRITAPLTPIANNNIGIIGRGNFNGGTIILAEPAPAGVGVITFGNSRDCYARDFWLAIQTASVDGWAIRLETASRVTLSDLLLSGAGSGVEIDRCNTTYLSRVRVTDVLGLNGIYIHGSGGSFNHVVNLDLCLVGQSYPLPLATARGNWAQSTAYLLGEVVRANSGLWQCSQAGTSAAAGVGPSGLPSTNPALVHVTAVTDGSCQWRYAMGAFVGFAHGSFAHTVAYDRCGVLQGDIGMRIFDDQGDAPTFVHAWNFASDHVFSRALQLDACDGAVMFAELLAISTLSGGIGVEVGVNATRWQFDGGEVLQNMLIRGTAGVIHGMSLTSLELAATAAELAIGSNHISGTPAITISAGADDFAIVGNVLPGGITDGAGPAVSRRIDSNVGAPNSIPLRIGIAADGTRDPARSSPGTTVTAAGSGQYDLTFPPCTTGLCFGQFVDGTLASNNVQVIMEAPNYAAGTVSAQLSSGGNLAGGDTINVVIFPL